MEVKIGIDNAKLGPCRQDDRVICIIVGRDSVRVMHPFPVNATLVVVRKPRCGIVRRWVVKKDWAGLFFAYQIAPKKAQRKEPLNFTPVCKTLVRESEKYQREPGSSAERYTSALAVFGKEYALI
jgi:hypothetical protein